MFAMRSFQRPALILFALAGSGCGEAQLNPEQTVVDYTAAVQAQDYDRLFCLSAGAAGSEELGLDASERRANFRVWAEARYETHLAGRDEGQVALDDEGILVAKTFSLGSGTFATYGVSASPDADTRIVRSDLRFGYPQVDLSRYSPGTTLYLCGVPAGRIQPVRIPRGSREVSVTVLESISVDWGLVYAPAGDGCAARWTVASARPVESTAVSTELTWVF